MKSGAGLEDKISSGSLAVLFKPLIKSSLISGFIFLVSPIISSAFFTSSSASGVFFILFANFDIPLNAPKTRGSATNPLNEPIANVLRLSFAE